MLLKTLIMAFAVTVMASAELTIVATTGMVADITRHVVGEHGDVSSLMGEGVDPHLYKPTASDARKIMQADMIFYSGLLLEGRM
ncbi:MAG: metal ABC transporter substrate-binding protein, partial [Phycisphaerales bacterium]